MQTKKYDIENRISDLTPTLRAAMLWDSIDEQRAKRNVRHQIARFRRKKALIAASSAAAVFFAVLLLVWQSGRTDDGFAERAVVDVPFDRGVTLVAGDGMEYLLDDMVREITIGEGGNTLIKEGGKIIIEAPQNQTPNAAETQMVTMKIPRGREYQLVLPDGTKVWLSAESTIMFPERFADDSREVRMTGEAYFEVAHDTSRPFFVRTGDMELEVLGTVFNVYAYPEDRTVVTTLLEGSVRQSFGKHAGEVTLKPSQQTSYHKYNGTVAVNQIEAQDYRAYREGRIVFRDTPLEEILIALGRTFDFEIRIETAAIKYDRYNLTVSKLEDINIPLSKIKQTGGIAYEKNENVIIVR